MQMQANRPPKGVPKCSTMRASLAGGLNNHAHEGVLCGARAETQPLASNQHTTT